MKGNVHGYRRHVAWRRHYISTWWSHQHLIGWQIRAQHVAPIIYICVPNWCHPLFPSQTLGNKPPPKLAILSFSYRSTRYSGFDCFKVHYPWSPKKKFEMFWDIEYNKIISNALKKLLRWVFYFPICLNMLIEGFLSIQFIGSRVYLSWTRRLKDIYDMLASS